MSPSRTVRPRALALPLAVVALAASSCATHAPMDSLKPKGPESRYIDARFFPVFWIAVVVFFFVTAIAGYCMYRFRERSGDEAPVQVHGNTKLEVTWTIIPFLLLVGVGITSVIGIFHLYQTPKGSSIALDPASATSDTPQLQGDVLQVSVFAHRWWFEYHYPGLGAVDPQSGQPGDLVTANELHIPAGKMVRLKITSNEPAASPEGKGPGVIHNYWIPALAGKIYAIPGHITYLNLEADSKAITDGHPVTYLGQCSEFCGASHANMRIRAVAQSTADFAAWVGRERTVAKPLAAGDQFSSPDAFAGYTLFNGGAGCATCHAVDGTKAAGQVGPNLTHLQDRSVFAGAIFDLNDTNLRTWLRNPQAAKPGANMKIRKLSEDEITKLIAYLDTLK